MSDIVVTVPAHFWRHWIDEGDLPGTDWDGRHEYSYSVGRCPRDIAPGERVYVVAHGRLRGYAPLVRLHPDASNGRWLLIRRGGAVALTIPEPIAGFRGYRYRWWSREAEVPFPDWRTHGCE